MNALNANPSKVQEIAHWQAFLATLPQDSYLAMYFGKSTELLQQAMANDMHIEPMAELRQRYLRALDDVNAEMAKLTRLRAESDALTKAIRQMESDKRHLASRLQETLSEARTLLRAAENAVINFDK